MHFHRPKGLLSGFLARGDRGGIWSEAGEFWAPADWKIGRHANAGWEVYLQTRGSSDWRVGKREFSVPEGGYYLIAPDVRHELLRFHSSEAHFYFVVFRPEKIAPAISCEWPRPLIHGPQAHLLESPFRGLMREVTLADPEKELGIACYLGALSLELCRLQKRQQAIEPELAAHPATLRAKEFMDNQPGEPWKLDELAGLCGVSIPHLITLFRKDFRTTPRQYLLQKRLERAGELLRSGNRTVTEAALDCGFSSSQHFAQAFRRQFGRTPRTERNLSR